MIGRAAAIIGIALVAASCGGHGRRSEFTAHVDNPWFPLRPGTTLVYHGVKDGRPSRDIVRVTGRRRTIDGVPCVAVSDRLYEAGRLEERTTDWYTQDARGNVWYYGEDTAELTPAGQVKTTEGTWLAGRDGAKPGIYMPAHPRVGDEGRQEYYKGHAEDRFVVLSVHAKLRWRGATAAVLTKETTPLEPDVVDHKYYVRGVGTVLEETVKGGNERNTLISVKRS